MSMTKEEKKWLAAALAIVAICAAAYLFVGCAGPTGQRVTVGPDGVQHHANVTPYNIPGTDVAVWNEVEDLPTPAAPTPPPPHTETTWAGEVIKSVTPWGEYLWPLLILAFKRPRDNAAAAAKRAVSGDLGGALEAVAAAVGIQHTPVDVKVTRAAKDNLKAAKAAARRARKLDIGA